MREERRLEGVIQRELRAALIARLADWTASGGTERGFCASRLRDASVIKLAKWTAGRVPIPYWVAIDIEDGRL